MKKIDGVTYLTIGELAKKIHRSTITIKSWLDWYNQQPEEIKKEFPLPEFHRDLDKRHTRFIEENQVRKFMNFRDSVVYGKLSLMEKQREILEG